jgi:hypothetical protein
MTWPAGSDRKTAHVWSAHRYIRPGSVLTIELDGSHRYGGPP